MSVDSPPGSERDEVSSADLIHFLDERVLKISSDGEIAVAGPTPVLPGKPGFLSFANSGRSPHEVEESASSVVLVSSDTMEAVERRRGQILIAVANPRLEYARVLQQFFTRTTERGVSVHAAVDSTAVIGEASSVGAGAYIAAGVVIGERCTIGPNCVILEGTLIGDDTTVGPNTTIGHVGFGYAREPDGSPVLVPHLGGVRIGSFVDIGANTCIDRGTLDDTVIEDHVKIDNLVHVAHNCTIQEGAFVIATAILCGGVTVGQRSWISPNATVKQQLTVGHDAVVGLAATVLGDVPPNAVVVGSPAKELRK